MCVPKEQRLDTGARERAHTFAQYYKVSFGIQSASFDTELVSSLTGIYGRREDAAHLEGGGYVSR